MCVLPKAKVGRLGCAAAVAALLLVTANGRVLADSACLNAATKLDQSEIEAFLADPAQLLEDYPAGGPALSARVQRLAASDTSTVDVLIALAGNAKPAHVVSLSMGLGRAAAHCAAKRPDLAREIKELVASHASPSLRALFTSEATVSELARGAPTLGVSVTATGAATQRPPQDAGLSSKETLDSILKDRRPEFLLPADFSLPPGEESATRTIAPNRDGDNGAPSAADSTSPATTATSSDTVPFLSSLRGGAPPTLLESTPSGLLETSEGGAPLTGDVEGMRTPLPAARSLGADDSLHWSPKDGSSGYEDVVSPTR